MSDKTYGAQTVMVVESNEDSRFLLRCLFEMKGYRVLEAGNGDEAVSLALQEHPDLILLELKLPLRDCFSTARQIRQTVELGNVPIVVISTFPSSQHRAVAIAAGCNEYMIKPIEFDELEALVTQLLGTEYSNLAAA